MTFERLEMRARAGRSGASGPAAISIGGQGSAGGRPSVIVSLSPALASDAGFAKGMFSVHLGKDDDAGKLRIAADSKGVVLGYWAQRHKAMLFNLGHVPAIGSERCRKQFTDAKVVEPGIVEIDIPDFTAAVETEDDEEGEPGQGRRLPAQGPVGACRMNTALYQVMPALAFILARPRAVAPSPLRLQAPAADEDAEFSEVHESSVEDEDD